MGYDHEKRVALEAVTNAARLCTMVRAEMVVDSLQKGDKSPVTIADFSAQALVCQHLQANFPQDVIVGEEDSADLKRSEDKLVQVIDYVQRFHADASPRTICSWIDAGNGAVAERYWTVDPIDGTKGFLRNDQYAIALGLVEAGEVKVAALACPALPLDFSRPDSPVGTIFVAVRGEGAAMAALDGGDFRPISVAAPADVAQARFVESVESDHGNHQLQQAVAKAVGISQPSLRMDSQAKYGAVARGDATLYLRLPSPTSPDYREKIWDHAAGALIVQEAGGQVSDMVGKPLDFASDFKMHANQGVVASNGAIHPAAIERLSQEQIK